jgi:hypothetical protein
MIIKDDPTYGLVVENNVMIGWPGGCIQAQFWNTPGADIRNNTIWRSQCSGLRFAYDATRAGSAERDRGAQRHRRSFRAR